MVLTQTTFTLKFILANGLLIFFFYSYLENKTFYYQIPIAQLINNNMYNQLLN